jgi:hypothetical protein
MGKTIEQSLTVFERHANFWWLKKNEEFSLRKDIFSFFLW